MICPGNQSCAFTHAILAYHAYRNRLNLLQIVNATTGDFLLEDLLRQAPRHRDGNFT